MSSGWSKRWLAVRIAKRHSVVELIPVATATIRDAANADLVRQRLRQAAGVDLVSLCWARSPGG